MMQRLIRLKGVSETDDAIVEMALKMASIHALMGQHEKAEMGYAFCVDTQRSKLMAEVRKCSQTLFSKNTNYKIMSNYSSARKFAMNSLNSSTFLEIHLFDFNIVVPYNTTNCNPICYVAAHLRLIFR